MIRAKWQSSIVYLQRFLSNSNFFLYFSDDPKHRQVLKEFNRQESQDVASSSRSPGMNMAVFLVFIDCLVNNITINNLVIAPAMNKCNVH